jgi:hypothetical protein
MGDQMAKAFALAEKLKGMRPTRSRTTKKRFAQTLFDCAIKMGCNLQEAHSVLQAAMALSILRPVGETTVPAGSRRRVFLLPTWFGCGYRIHRGSPGIADVVVGKLKSGGSWVLAQSL